MIRLPLDRERALRGLPFVAIDCEGTDFAGPKAHVVEVAVVHGTFGSDDVQLVYTSRVKPPVPIPASATDIHGITDEDVALSPTWADVWPHVAALCRDRLPVGWSAPADYLYIRHECERLGLAGLPWPWLDLFVVRKATKVRGAPGSLVEVAGEYTLALDAHGAAGDALTTALLVRPMMRAAWKANAFRGPAGAPGPVRGYGAAEEEDARPVRIDRLGELLDWQAGAARYQERDFWNYRLEKGAVRPPRMDWHTIEGWELPAWREAVTSAPCPTCRRPTVLAVKQDGRLERVDAVEGRPLHVCPS